ncbi:MAG: alkaline phosphatase [Thermoanaerobaculia bacterium]
MNRFVTVALLLLVVVALVSGAFYIGRNGTVSANAESLAIGREVARPPMLPRVDAPRAKNLILIIGDGMGTTQVTAGRVALRGAGGILWLQTLPSGALVRTQSASSLVPDSAAAGTALATGVRVANGAVSIDPSGRPLKTLFERAREQGLAAGLITTTDIADATPAAFSAHVSSRKDELEIARQQATGGMEVLLGCGPEKFLPRSRGGERKDGVDLVDALRKSGYAVTLDPAALAPSGSGRLLGLFAEANRPPLPTLTKSALETLSHDPDGFVLLVENEEIDSASHNHQLGRLIRGMAELDEAVRVALEFAKADGNTLVVVTADHESGGMELVDSKTEGTLGVRWATGNHTAQPVPLYAWGPGAASFGGEIDNTEVHALLAKALGLDDTSTRP